MAKLQYLVSGETRDIPLDQKLTIGRADTNQVRLSHQDVSRVHAAILRSGGDYVLQDLDSRNGVMVNGRRETRIALRDGDLVSIAEYRFTFVADQEPAALGTIGFRSAPVAPPAPAPAAIPPSAQSAAAKPQPPPPQLVPAPEMPTTAIKLDALSSDSSAPVSLGAGAGQIFFSLEEIGSSGGALSAELALMRSSLAASLDDTSAPSGSLFEQLLISIISGIGADRGALVLRRPEGGLRLAACFPGKHKPAISRVVLRATLRQRQAVLCNSAFENDSFRSSPSVLRDQTPALMAIPLVRGEQSVGLLYLDSTTHPDLFRREHLALAGFLGQILALLHAGAAGAQAHPAGEKTDLEALLGILNGRYLSSGRRRARKIEALDGLGRHASAQVIRPLVSHLADSDPLVAEAAAVNCTAFGLKTCPPASVMEFHRELLRLLADAGPARRARAAEVLRRLHPHRSPLKERLEQFAADAAVPVTAQNLARELIRNEELPDSTFFLSSDEGPSRLNLRG